MIKISQKKCGQVMLEFTFSMTILLLMIFGTMKIFQWTGLELAERRQAHESVLSSSIVEDYGECLDWQTCSFGSYTHSCCMQWSDVGYEKGPVKQLDPYFSTPLKFNAIWDGK